MLRAVVTLARNRDGPVRAASTLIRGRLGHDRA
jgi:hypothetical protein